MNKINTQFNYSNWQLFGLTLLRMLIGWHFLFEGLIKIYNPAWSSKQYLLGSSGPLSSLFHNIANNDSLIKIADILNEWGLILIGLSLFIGIFTKTGSISGIVLLSLYYLAYPPFGGLEMNSYVEGNYWLVNKNLIEMASLFVLILFPTGKITGIDHFIFKKQLPA